MSTTQRRNLLTTGQAADMLGCSQQHVVNLCSRGDLPFEMVGFHRRIPSEAVEALREGSMTRDQRRSLALSLVVASKLVRNPAKVLRIGRRNLARLQRIHTKGQAADWLARWNEVLDSPAKTLEILTSTSPSAREMRQNSPFAGVLTTREREQALAGFKEVEAMEQVGRSLTFA